MRLKEIVAEWLYLNDTSIPNHIPFREQVSGVRDCYYRLAIKEMPSLLSGYISNHGWLGKLIRGCIQDFINSHGTTLNKESFGSLEKRITAGIQAEIKKASKED
jgi:hypothetical protein